MTTPYPEEIAEAHETPGGWVYRIAGHFRQTDAIPPEAIVGAWKVDDDGNIVGEFVQNQKYDPVRWPRDSGE